MPKKNRFFLCWHQLWSLFSLKILAKIWQVSGERASESFWKFFIPRASGEQATRNIRERERVRVLARSPSARSSLISNHFQNTGCRETRECRLVIFKQKFFFEMRFEKRSSDLRFLHHLQKIRYVFVKQLQLVRFSSAFFSFLHTRILFSPQTSASTSSSSVLL